MKKRLFWILFSLILTIGTYLLSGYICDIFDSYADNDRKIPIYCVDCKEKKLALTFDNAWGNEDTEKIIEILKNFNIPATFFVTGQWAEKYPDDVKKLYDAGNDIANHSFSHPHIEGMTKDELKSDAEKCNEAIKNITGKAPTLYRGPYGEYNNTLIEMLHENNMYYIQWDVDSLDWKNPEPEQLVKNVTEKVQNGSIVLLHSGSKNTPEALPSILKELTAEGYEFVLVKDLIFTENYIIDHTGKQILQ